MSVTFILSVTFSYALGLCVLIQKKKVHICLIVYFNSNIVSHFTRWPTEPEHLQFSEEGVQRYAVHQWTNNSP